MQELPRKACCTDPEAIKTQVDEGYYSFGHLLDNIDAPAILVDAQCRDFPIVGISRGFHEMSGWDIQEVKGKNCRMMFEGVPSATISRSSRKNIANFCNMCRLEGIEELSECHAVQPNARRDGSHFINLFLLGLCKVNGRQFILGVQRDLGKGLLMQMKRDQMNVETEALRCVLRRVRDRVCSDSLQIARDHSIAWSPTPSDGTSTVDTSGSDCEAAPEFKFYKERLQDHCMLLNKGFTAVRREAEELSFGCLTFGDRPMRQRAGGLSFTVRVDDVTDSFLGLPVLGFTRRAPQDKADLFPAAVRCLGSSVLIGADGEAFARDKHDHFKIGFKAPPQTEVQRWAPASKPEPASLKLKSGDVLRCSYTSAGHMELQRNGEVIVEYDTGRPIDKTSDYYAVVDVCLCACSVTLLGSPPGQDEPPSIWTEAEHAPPSIWTEEQQVPRTSSSISDEQSSRWQARDPSSEGQRTEDEIHKHVSNASPRHVDYEVHPILGEKGGLGAYCGLLPLAPKLDKALVSLHSTGLRGGTDVLTIAMGLFFLCGTAWLIPNRSQR